MTSEIKVNNIKKASGSSITIGESGDTITLATGASQTGFGRTGTVDWQTSSIKTATFTAANGEGYFCNTTSSAFTVNLPAGSAGAIVSIQDYNNTFDSNGLTVTPNGSEKINGGGGSIVLSSEGEGVTLVYIDSTVGWRSIQDSAFSDVGSNFVSASGGTITTSGNCKIHTFTSPGTFTVNAVAICSANNVVSHLVVAGGGGGGVQSYGGAGGAGGFREVKSPVTPYTASPKDGYPSAPNRITVTGQAYPITVGAGGASGAPSGDGANGSASIFSTITSAGGGYGGGGPFPVGCGHPGAAGGSGGGGSGIGPAGGSTTGGAGNTPPVSPSQGNNGGSVPQGSATASGGGGGATAVGGNTPNSTTGGSGGAGATTSITASPVAYSGGGGGVGTGGNGSASPCGTGGAYQNAGTTNRGGGGGSEAAGGSGVVIIRYKFQ